MQLAEIIPGFRHSGRFNREGLSEGLVDLWLLDSSTVTSIAALPWVRDGVADWDYSILSAWVAIALVDNEMGKQVAGFTWMSGRLADDAWVWLTGLGDIASRDLELARALMAIPWFTDGGTGFAAVANLAELAAKDLELARTVAVLPWFTDGLTSDEASTLAYLDRAASTDLEFARALAGRPWFTDSAIEVHWGKVQNLQAILARNPRLARWLSELDLSRDWNDRLLSQVYLLTANEQDLVSRITSRPWFEDGLDREEGALLVALFGEVRRNTDQDSFFQALLESYYTQSKTVSLPLAGEVGIWVFQSAPFSSGEDAPAIMEEVVRAVEGFVGSPLPTTDVIVLIEDLPPDKTLSTMGEHGSYIKVNTNYEAGIGGLRPAFIRALSNLYRFSPRWLNDILPEFVQGRVSHRMGIRSMEEVRAGISPDIHYSCTPEGIATISDALSADQSSGREYPSICTRALGLSFLHEAFDLMGEEGMTAALRELSTLVELRGDAAEEAVFRTLLSHTPPDRQEEFRELYRRLHGGPYADS